MIRERKRNSQIFEARMHGHKILFMLQIKLTQIELSYLILRRTVKSDVKIFHTK